MKPTLLISVVLACGGVLSACAAGRDADTLTTRDSKALQLDRNRIASELLRVFLTEVTEPQTANKRFIGVVNIYYVRVAAGARINLDDFSSKLYRLKTASGRELESGNCIDDTTQQPCAVVDISIRSVDGDNSVASIFWMQSPRSGGGLDYQLIKRGGIWQIAGIVGISAI